MERGSVKPGLLALLAIFLSNGLCNAVVLQSGRNRVEISSDRAAQHSPVIEDRLRNAVRPGRSIRITLDTAIDATQLSLIADFMNRVNQIEHAQQWIQDVYYQGVDPSDLHPVAQELQMPLFLAAFGASSQDDDLRTAIQSQLQAARAAWQTTVQPPPITASSLLLQDLPDADPNGCPICLGSFTDVVQGPAILPFPCNHPFHDRCINGWFSAGHNSCPLCRSCRDQSQNADVSGTNANVSPTNTDALPRPSRTRSRSAIVQLMSRFRRS